MTWVAMFSGGAGSWAAARVAVSQAWLLNDDVVLLFADTLTEDADLYRFVDDAVADLRAHAGANQSVTLERVADGRTIWEVFRDERFLGNSRVDPCSRVLKREPLRRWLEANCDPGSTTVVLGYDATEAHRVDRARRFWAPWQMRAPLVDDQPMTRAQILDACRRAGLRLPRLYDLGFAHNNCGGGCVKAGQGAFRHLLQALPDTYATWEAGEARIRADLGRDVTILTDRAGGERRPITLEAFRERVQAGLTAGDGIWAGCGCLDAPDDDDRGA